MIEQEVINMSEEEAVSHIEKSGFRARISSVNGKGLIGTCDYRLDRINLHLENGIVVRANKG